MSYILDALKKAERERGRTRARAPITVEDRHGTPRSLRLALIGGCVILAAAVLWLSLPLLSTRFRAQVQPAATASRREGNAAGSLPVNTLPSGAERKVPAAPEAGSQNPDRMAGREIQPRARMGSHPKSTVAHGQQNPVVSKEAAAAGSDAGSSGRVAGPGRAAAAAPDSAREEAVLPQPAASAANPANQVITRPAAEGQAKPESLQEAASRMTVTLVMYAEAEADRFVFINGRKYVKGDYVDGLYLIEDITLDGVTLSYKGERAVLRK